MSLHVFSLPLLSFVCSLSFSILCLNLDRILSAIDKASVIPYYSCFFTLSHSLNLSQSLSLSLFSILLFSMLPFSVLSSHSVILIGCSLFGLLVSCSNNMIRKLECDAGTLALIMISTFFSFLFFLSFPPPFFSFSRLVPSVPLPRQGEGGVFFLRVILCLDQCSFLLSLITR